MFQFGFLNILRKKHGVRTLPTSRRQVSGDETAPKNGRLTLAVAATLIIMFVLAGINLRLIRDPSIACKAFGPSVPSQPETHLPKTGTEAAAAKKAFGYEPPQVTFYRQLTAVDDPPQTVLDTSGSIPPGAQNDSLQDVSAALPDNDKKSNQRSVVSASGQGCEQTGSPKSLKLPQSKPGRKRYTVQVGAFTNPGIAKQWALKWKARGYIVSLKPVARPRTGVIYRLYLGSFSSEKQADELVKRLKSKEGISALRLLVRN